jgi:diguanylate cyclase (GGDEF)-like protein
MLDANAFSIFKTLSGQADTPELRHFWGKMSDEENEHVLLWDRVAELINNQMLPEVFDDPENILAELKEVEFKVNRLWDRYQKAPNLLNAFMLAYRMEFYMMHQAFEAIFNYTASIPGETNPFDAYEIHIQDFVDMLIKYGKEIPELEILGEVLQRLWRKNRELSIQVSIDELTQILNRRGFFKAVKPLLHLAQRNHQTVGILMADIDDFKKVNDTHGHQIGDDVLKETAQRIQKSIRASDIAGRYGGEEFIVLFSAIEKESLHQLAEKLRRGIKKETANHIPVTVSIGAVADRLSTDVDKSLVSLIKEADDCLYRAKHAGKNKVVIKRL